MPEVQLSTLRPEYRRVFKDFTPETGGVGTDEYDLSFDCPTCGSPSRILIRIGPVMDVARHVWQVAPPEPFMGWVDVMTVSPSIGNESRGHGKHRPPCPFHGHIVSGKVIWP